MTANEACEITIYVSELCEIIWRRKMSLMSDRLRLAFEEASKLSEREQDAFAAFIIAELQDESGWQARFDNSQEALSRLAASALKEHRQGNTRPLDDLFK